ncbi:hypothetical protein V1525DRAFT_385358 [Lipomyces kononenkoae]|uniref:Uncharacterized protein n=1 Tax=Lipomyces kononenkoae TaxID=34357 RepID=A0ACC3T9V9_LIPKO
MGTISRRPFSKQATRPFWRIDIDLFSEVLAYNGMQYIMLITDEYTGIFALNICVIFTDGETSLGAKFTKWYRQEGIELDQPAPSTPSSNGRAERAGGGDPYKSSGTKN